MLSLNIMHNFYRQKIIRMYLLDQYMIQRNETFILIKTLFWIYYLIN